MKSVVLFEIKDLWKVHSCNKFLKLSEEAPTLATQSFHFIHSVWISFGHHFFHSSHINSQTFVTIFDDFKVFTRDTWSVLQRTSSSLCSLNISCSMAAINTLSSVASLSARVSEANGLFVTWSSFFDDQHIRDILFIMPQTKMIKPACEDPSSKLT